MNPELSPDRTTTKLPSQIRSWFQQHLVSTTLVLTCLNLGLTGAATWNISQTSQQLDATIANSGGDSRELRADRQARSTAILLELLSLSLLVVTGSVVVLAIGRSQRDLARSQTSLAAVQAHLLELNEQATHKDQVLAVREQSQANAIQTEIGHILEVVSAIEQGNLTVRADVNTRSTGSIAETFNRLIDSLHQIMSVVVASTDCIVESTAGLEKLAIDTPTQAQHQTRSMQQIETSIAKIHSLSDNSYHQASATTTAVELAQSATSNGQQELIAMACDIESLQQGTQQIGRRVQNLHEFLEFARQFSKDRQRVVALSRVLALNAALLSTRALAERDPAQFASLAHEFKTIADRVNELAEDNNISLATFQHRTNQIQTVTSGLDRDVTDIDQLVQKFTAEIGTSRQAFTDLQQAIDRVAIFGEHVSTSSQEIVHEASETLTAIQSIESIAHSNEQQVTITYQQIQTIGDLAQTLRHRVEYFRLNDKTPATPNFLPPADSTVVKNYEAVAALLTVNT
jgi:methyl-accepting chemotaxis protein PixJ